MGECDTCGAPVGPREYACDACVRALLARHGAGPDTPLPPRHRRKSGGEFRRPGRRAPIISSDD